MGQCGSRAGRSTVDALAYLKGAVARHRRIGRHKALVMIDVVATFSSTSRQRVVKMLVDHKAHPTVIKLARHGPIETWVDGKSGGGLDINCGVPQGSPCSPVLFSLTLAEVLKEDRKSVV